MIKDFETPGQSIFGVDVCRVGNFQCLARVFFLIGLVINIYYNRLFHSSNHLPRIIKIHN